MSDDIILPDDPRAAYKVLVTPLTGGPFGEFWMSRHEIVFRDEADARWHGSTHRKCECGEVFYKNSYCQPCAAKRAEERYMALPTRDWDGEMICNGDETYIDSFDEMADLIAIDAGSPNGHWFFAEHPEPREIDIDDYFCDSTYDGFKFSDDTYAAAAAMHELVERDFKNVYAAGGTRVTFDAFNAWLAEQENEDAEL